MKFHKLHNLIDSSPRIMEEYNESGISYLVLECWTSDQRRAHSLHEISYRACFKPRLPEFFISKLTNPGDSVLDPFLGRGTTAVQAALMERKIFGSDINPLSLMLTRPRLSLLSLEAIKNRLAKLPSIDKIPEKD